MNLIPSIAIALVAALHLYFCYLEMWAWETAGKKAFKGSLPEHLFAPTKGLAANLGLYNAFLAAGLLWSLWIKDPVWAQNIASFFLGCILIAGLYGAFKSSKKILFVQALPAAVALVLVWLKW